MIVDRQSELNKILECIAEELNIPSSKFEDAENKYSAVGEWLGKSDSELFVYDPNIFPQGSIKLGTCIKPLGRDEYDVDLVCNLNIPSAENQERIYNLVGERLKKHSKYESILEPKNRCWRLKYAGDFHMDILPAIPDLNNANGSLLVPDKELKTWKQTNPEGYANWFFERMEVARIQIYEKMKAEIDPVPEHKIKTPLQKSVQILKRLRDIKFQDDIDDKPVSIIITTLSAKAYDNETNLYEALANIIDKMPEQFDLLDGDIAVLNPTNREENFADKWKTQPQRRDKFFNWLKNLKQDLEELLGITGLQDLSEKIQPMFGEDITKMAIKNFSEHYSSQRNSLKMNPKSGVIGMVGTTIPKNTFYGN